MIHLRKKKKEEHTPKVKKKTGIIQSILNPIVFAKNLYDDDQVMTNAATITLFMVCLLYTSAWCSRRCSFECRAFNCKGLYHTKERISVKYKC